MPRGIINLFAFLRAIFTATIITIFRPLNWKLLKNDLSDVSLFPLSIVVYIAQAIQQRLTTRRTSSKR